MTFRRRSMLFLFIAFPFLHGHAQETRTFPEIGWTIRMPEGFTEQTAAQRRSSQQRGNAAFKESIGVTVDVSELRTLFSRTKGKFNAFDATIRRFDPKTEGDHAEASKAVREALFETMQDQMPKAQIDSVTTQVLIGGLRFERFSLKVTLNEQRLMEMVMLSRLHRGFDFGITYVCLDPVACSEVEGALATSRFEAEKPKPRATMGQAKRSN